ncbi:DUF1476 domain-containing protein [Aestuariispira insulae]|uniref:DUF1476 domain-containing protein n=1 Tax=Aestuariispira insulae TaxID=1461337 RepID=A0A3D9HKZ4_9PROT|nr:DUF1476 domain-containing protein [Aestuariispira insulae]RED49971.1 hypothetical protein DFP90_105344 [Aestuariispira insulae]
MTQFDDIEKAREAKFSHEQEVEFKAIMRRNKLIGLWAADEMGLTGADADAYAKTIIDIDFEKVGHEDVVQKLLADMLAKGVETSDHIVRKQMDDLLVEAKKQLASAAD